MKIWFTLTGLNHYYGQDFLKEGMKVRLEKEPDNTHDREAIRVMMAGIGHIGYVANSTWTVLGESYSAGRLYDKIGNTATGKVRLITGRGVLCTLKLKGQKGHVLPDEHSAAPEAQDDPSDATYDPEAPEDLPGMAYDPESPEDLPEGNREAKDA